MKYKLVGDNDISNPMENVLINRDIKNIKTFLKPTSNVCISPLKLKNIMKAAQTLLKVIKDGGELFIQVDSDP